MTTSIAFSPLSKLEYRALSYRIWGKLFAHIALFFPYYFNVWVLKISMVEPGLMCYCISKWSSILLKLLFFSFLFQYWSLVIFIVCCVLVIVSFLKCWISSSISASVMQRADVSFYLPILKKQKMPPLLFGYTKWANFYRKLISKFLKNDQTKSVLKFQPTAINSSWEIINKNLFNV